MEQQAANNRLHALSIWRNLLLVGLALSLTTNVLLAVDRLYSRRDVVVMPSAQTGKPYVLGAKVNGADLEDMARSIAYTILNVTPGSTDYVLNSVLTLTHPSFYGEFKRFFDQWMIEIKRRNLSTAFYPLTLKSDPKNLRVTIRGILKSFIGEKEVDAEQTTYHLTFDYTGTRLTLLRFEEEKQDSK